MPAPLLWLGAAALSAYAGNKLNEADLRKRRVVDVLPGESPFKVTPCNGAIVTCGVYGVLDHTGIWVDGNIYELNGNGLVRCISPTRFVQDRSGECIYVACNQQHAILSHLDAVGRCQDELYHVYNYHVLKNNCHRFVASMLAGESINITSFADLNEFLHAFFAQTIVWHQAKVRFV